MIGLGSDKEGHKTAKIPALQKLTHIYDTYKAQTKCKPRYESKWYLNKKNRKQP